MDEIEESFEEIIQRLQIELDDAKRKNIQVRSKVDDCFGVHITLQVVNLCLLNEQ